MGSQAMVKTLLVNVLCIFPLLSLGGSSPAWKSGKLEHFLPSNKDKTATAACYGESRSILKHIDVKHQWVIEDFRDQEALRKLISIPTQSAEFGSPDNKYKFRISLESAEGPQRTITLHSLNENGPLSCKVRHAIVSAKDGSVHELSSKVIHLEKTKGDMQMLEVPLPDNLEEYINDGSLVVLCGVTIYERTATVCDKATTAVKENESSTSPEEARFSEDPKAFVRSFKKLLEDKTTADLDVKASDCAIRAHRSIVSARSPVMGSMIEESEEGYLLNATDFSCDAMNCIVNYIYTDKCKLKPEIAEEVLLAADEYHLPELKQVAESQLIRSLDKKNIASRAKLAQSVGSTDLARAVASYIIGNPKVLNSDEWKKLEMKESCPSALILREIVLHT